METLILTSNYFRDFEEIEILSTFKNLTTLSILDNVITKKDNYRLYVIHLVPTLKYLDFKKVTKTEKESSLKLFGKVKTFDLQEKLTPEQVNKIKEAIKNAKTLQEVARFEEALKYQKFPKDLK